MTTDTISNSGDHDELADLEDSVTTDEARSLLKETLFSALKSGNSRLIDAPTSLGKSYQVARTPWREYPEVTGGEPVIHVHQTRKARDGAIEESEDSGVSYHVLEGRQDSCPTAAGEYDDSPKAPNGLSPSEWFDWKCDGRKAHFSKAHSKLDAAYGLPCTKNGNCPSQEQWRRNLRDEDGLPTFDVVHTTANFAHVADLIKDANVIFDERPNYALTLNDTQCKQFEDSLSNLLDDRSDGGRAMFDVRTALLRDRPEIAQELRGLLDDEVSPEQYFGYKEMNRLAPDIGLAILNAEEIFPNRWMGEHDGVRVVLDGSGKLRHVQHRPDFSSVRCIIGLDAFPSAYRWRLNTAADLERIEVLSAQERRRWRQEERKLRVVQVGDATRSYSRGWNGAGKERASGLIHKLREKHGSDFRTCICSSKTEPDVHRMMEEAEIEQPLTMHYGGQNSRNDFKNEDFGLLIGCIDPGDEIILDLLALGGRSAQPEMMETEDGHEVRKPGRSFVGPDSEIAEELLESVRETNLAQAAGRYARKPESSSSSATVYVWSDACPESLVDEVLQPHYHSMTGKKGKLAEELQEESLRTAHSISDSVGMDKSYAIECLKQFESQGVANKREGAGVQGADEWYWTGGNVETLVEFE